MIRLLRTPSPLLMRISASGLAALLLVVGFISLNNYAGSTTDENVFVTIPSRAYVVRGFPGRVAGVLNVDKLSQGENSARDAVQAGDFVFGVRKQRVVTPADLAAILADVPPDSSVSLLVYQADRRIATEMEVRRSVLGDSTFRELSGAVVVTAITAGGASDRAGMLVGDVITRINGQPFKTDMQADVILRLAQIGKTITYDIIRGDREMTLHLTLARFGFMLSLLLLSLSGLVTFGLGLFLMLKRPTIKAAWMVGSTLLLIGFYFIVGFARRDIDPVFATGRDLLMSAAMLFGMAIGAKSAAYFPRERPEMIARRWVWRALYGLALVLFVAVIALGERFVGTAALVMLLAIAAAKILFRKTRTAEDRRLTRPLRIVTFSVLSIVFVVLVLTAVYRLQFDVRYLGTALLVMPLMILYTIGRFRLLDIDLRVRRSLQYALVTIGWGTLMAIGLMVVFSLVVNMDFPLPLVVFTGSSVEVTSAPADPVVQELGRRGILMFVAIGVWYALSRLRKKGQTLIDEKYHRIHYDYRKAGEELAEVMATNLSMVGLARGIVEKLSSWMQVKRAGILFFRDELVCCCQEAYGIGESSWNEFCACSGTALARALKGFEGEVRVDYLPEDLKATFRAHSFQYLVPIRSKDHLIGTIILGEKRSESSYSREDLAFLSSVARQASVAIENAFLYEELAEKERMKHELAIARRIQLGSLPQKVPQVKGLDIAGSSVPAMEVGGDFFDYLNGAPGALTVVVGDVSGKGTSAALYMSKIQGILRSLHEFNLTPADLFIRANRLLCGDLEKNSFVTAVGAAFEPGVKKLLLARAGHLPLYRYRASTGNVDRVTPRGLGLGLENEGLFSKEIEEQSLEYAKGDVLLFVTDGVIDARNGRGEEFGEEGMVRTLTHASERSAAEIRDVLFEELKEFTREAPQLDDQTIVVVKAV